MERGEANTLITFLVKLDGRLMRYGGRHVVEGDDRGGGKTFFGVIKLKLGG